MELLLSKGRGLRLPNCKAVFSSEPPCRKNEGVTRTPGVCTIKIVWSRQRTDPGIEVLRVAEARDSQAEFGIFVESDALAIRSHAGVLLAMAAKANASRMAHLSITEVPTWEGFPGGFRKPDREGGLDWF